MKEQNKVEVVELACSCGNVWFQKGVKSGEEYFFDSPQQCGKCGSTYYEVMDDHLFYSILKNHI